MVHVEIMASTVLGASLASFLIRYFIQRMLKDLEKALHDLDGISKAFVGVNIRLERVEKDVGLVHEHDRKISAMEALSLKH